MTVKDVAEMLHVSWGLVRDIQQRYLSRKNILKGTRWLLLKNPAKLDPELNEAKRLAEALEINRPLAAAYYLE